MSQFQLSAGVYQRVLKLANAIADLARSEKNGAKHLRETLQERPGLND
jgi:predicted ATPase with chaperone activity